MTEQERGPGVVRPLRARTVRQEAAAQTVSQMLDALPAAQRPPDRGPRREAPRVIDLEAYDESGPSLYVYRLRRGDAHHVGIVAEVSTEGFVDGRVRGHEAVQGHRVDALVDHFTSAVVRSELVALLHESGPAVDAVIAECRHRPPLIRFTGPDEWEQQVWRVPESAHEALCAELSRGVHYIADGHHRVAASLRVWQQAGRPAGDGLMSVIYRLDGLRLLAFHRRVIGPVRGEELLSLLSDSFDVCEIDRPDEATGCFGLYLQGCWYDATYRGEPRAGAAGLDVTILDDNVLRPLLGPGSGPDPRLEITPALSPVTELAAACDSDGGALFTLRPPSLAQLIEVADRGEVMPPKATYFDPKPYAGIFLR